MKKQIIKKLMAYLMVGAMVVATPMTASASPLTDAYSGTGDNDQNKNSDTNTDTNTRTLDTEDVDEYDLNIFGIVLDKETIKFDSAEGEVPLQARVLFDSYDAADELMQWASLTYEQKKKIEKSIHWVCADIEDIQNSKSSESDVAKVTPVKDDNTKALVKALKDGNTSVYAWIEADRKAYKDYPDMPTAGDYIAKCEVSVAAEVTDILFNEKETKIREKFVAKRTYNLAEYTNLVFGKGENAYSKPVKDCATSVVFSNVKVTKGANSRKNPKATITDAGMLKITSAEEGDKIGFTITAETGTTVDKEITIAKAVPAGYVSFTNLKPTIDMGKDGQAGNKNNTMFVGDHVGKSIEDIIVLDRKNGSNIKDTTTDEFIWTTNKKAIADVVRNEENDGKTATIIANGVGTAKITVKATSGKKETLTVTVKATPNDVKILDAETCTGKPVTMEAVLTGENGLVVPQGKTKFTWGIAPAESNSTKNGKINKSKGIVTPSNVLYASDNKTVVVKDTMKVTVSALLGKKNNPDFKKDNVTSTLTLKQSDIASLGIDIKQRKAGTGEWGGAIEQLTSDLRATKLTTTKLYVGQTYHFVPLANAGKTVEGTVGDASSIMWTSTGKGISSGLDGLNYKSNIISKTNATVKASYITLTKKSNGKITAAKKTKTITIKPVQMATSLTLNKTEVVVNPNERKDTKVTINVKALAPKTSTDAIQWKVLTADATNTEETVKGTPTPISGIKVATLKNCTNSVDNEFVDANGMKSSGTKANTAKNKKITITIPKGTKAGSVIKVGAYAEGGAVAYAYIYVTDKTTKVAPTVSDPATPSKKANGNPIKNNWDLTLGQTATVSATLTVNGVEGQTPAVQNWTKGDTTSYKNEPLRYTLDKKSAQVIKIDANGKITPLKVGKATVTIKTISGKPAKATINVKAVENK